MKQFPTVGEFSLCSPPGCACVDVVGDQQNANSGNRGARRYGCFERVLPVHAAREDCSDATNTYNSAISEVSDTLRRYTRCLSSSNGHDDCSSEFRRLKNAQSDFESAVSKYQRECN